MKHLLISILILASVISCKKRDTDPQEPTSPDNEIPISIQKKMFLHCGGGFSSLHKHHDYDSTFITITRNGALYYTRNEKSRYPGPERIFPTESVRHGDEIIIIQKIKTHVLNAPPVYFAKGFGILNPDTTYITNPAKLKFNVVYTDSVGVSLQSFTYTVL